MYHSTSSTQVLTLSWIKGVGKREGRGVGKRKEEGVKGGEGEIERGKK